MTSLPQSGTPRKRKHRPDPTRIVSAGVNPDEPRQHLVCRGCGQRFVIELPMLVDMFVAITKSFVKTHRYCPIPDEAKP